MERKRIHVKYKTFKALKQLLQTAIEGHEELIVEVDQNETYYLVRSYKPPKPNSYFASLQIRIDGVYLQLHTFVKGLPFDRTLFPQTLIASVDPGSRSLIFTKSINPIREELMELVQRAFN